MSPCFEARGGNGIHAGFLKCRRLVWRCRRANGDDAFRPALLQDFSCRNSIDETECRYVRLAEVWFSSYKEGTTPKLAAIIADVSEEQTVTVGSSFDQKERPPLNTRELDVLRLVVQGLANKEIASRMKISESGVKNTLQQLFSKTEVRTRSQLVRVALERYRDLL